MNLNAWSCLTTQDMKGIMPESVRHALMVTACEMAVEKREERLFASRECSGVVKTTWSAVSMGAVSGILFKSMFDLHDQVNCKANFLVNHQELNRAEELINLIREGSAPIEEVMGLGRLNIDRLYDFMDSASSGTMH